MPPADAAAAGAVPPLDPSELPHEWDIEDAAEGGMLACWQASGKCFIHRWVHKCAPRELRIAVSTPTVGWRRSNQTCRLLARRLSLRVTLCAICLGGPRLGRLETLKPVFRSVSLARGALQRLLLPDRAKAD